MTFLIWKVKKHNSNLHPDLIWILIRISKSIFLYSSSLIFHFERYQIWVNKKAIHFNLHLEPIWILIRISKYMFFIILSNFCHHKWNLILLWLMVKKRTQKELRTVFPSLKVHWLVFCRGLARFSVLSCGSLYIQFNAHSLQ